MGWRDWTHRNWKFQERGGVGVAQRVALWSFRGHYRSKSVEHYDSASPPGPFCPPLPRVPLKVCGKNSAPETKFHSLALLRALRDADRETGQGVMGSWRVTWASVESWEGAPGPDQVGLLARGTPHAPPQPWGCCLHPLAAAPPLAGLF